MKRILWLLTILCLAAAPSCAADLPEAAAAESAAAFTRALDVKPEHPAALAAPREEALPVRSQKVSLPEGTTPAAFKTLTLRGYVSLTGTGFEPRGSGYVMVTVTGWATLQDQDGHVLSGSVEFTSSDGYFVSSGFVSGWTHPSALVDVYDGGKLLGSTWVQGTVYVSGFDNGGSINLSGSGPVEGSTQISAPAQAVP